jgi:hypothetical protein
MNPDTKHCRKYQPAGDIDLLFIAEVPPALPSRFFTRIFPTSIELQGRQRYMNSR